MGVTSIYGHYLVKMITSLAGGWVCSATIGETQVEMHQIWGLPPFNFIAILFLKLEFCATLFRDPRAVQISTW